MIIAGIREKIKDISGGETYVILIILLVGFAGFGLGRLSKIQESRPEVTISNLPSPAVASSDTSISQGEDAGIIPAMPTAPLPVVETVQNFVGSRNGSKYHYPWCPGAQQIKEENKMWFATREEAAAAGYTPAANCKGL